MKQVYAARDEAEAYFAKGLLEQAGIESIVQSGDLGPILGAVPFTEETLPSVWVREPDFERAMGVLENLKTNTPPPRRGEPWTCPRCGEVIEPQFTHCWKCGTPRPESNAAG